MTTTQLKFEAFSALRFLRAPHRVNVGGREVHYVAFQSANDAPAIIILGGAFQNFTSFKAEARELSKIGPVILVDLPGQGKNVQPTSDLEFCDLSHILAEFVSNFQLGSVSLLAFSYGSAIGFHFARDYPNLCHKLILGGTTSRVRTSVAWLLEDSIQELNKSKMISFAQGVLMNLINFPRCHQTGLSLRILKSFYLAMLKLNDKERDQYCENTNRLLNLKDLSGTVECETLIVTGQYDSFTLPYENYTVARKCHKRIFALIENADHLANIEHRQVVINLYSHFLKAQKLSDVSDHLEGVLFPSDQEMMKNERRLDERLVPDDLKANLCIGGSTFAVDVRDICFGGVKIQLDRRLAIDKTWSVDLEIKFDQNISLQGYLIQQDHLTYRVVFKRNDFKNARLLENYLIKLRRPAQLENLVENYLFGLLQLR